MSRNRDDGGRYTGSVTDDDVLGALRNHPEPVATAGDLAEVIGVTGETVRRHLSSLRERGAVDRKTVGARAVVWWAVDREGAPPAAPLRGLVGLLEEETADLARRRSEEWREGFEDEVGEGGGS